MRMNKHIVKHNNNIIHHKVNNKIIINIMIITKIKKI